LQRGAGNETRYFDFAELPKGDISCVKMLVS